MTQAVLKVRSGRIPPFRRLLLVAIGLTVLSVAGMSLNAESIKMSGVSLVWLSNGFLIGVLLCAPKRQWPTFLLLDTCLDFALSIARSTPPIPAAVYSFCNITEVTIAAVLMFATIAPDPELTEARQLRSLLLYGVVLAPAVASTIAAMYLLVAFGAPFVHSFRSWYPADMLGTAMATPLYLSHHYRRRFSSRSIAETVGLFLLLTFVTVCVFFFTSYPTLWIGATHAAAAGYPGRFYGFCPRACFW